MGLDYCNIAGVPTCTWWGMGVQRQNLGGALFNDAVTPVNDVTGVVATGSGLLLLASHIRELFLCQ